MTHTKKDLFPCPVSVIRNYEGQPFPIACFARVDNEGNYIEGKCILDWLADLNVPSMTPAKAERQPCPRMQRTKQR